MIISDFHMHTNFSTDADPLAAPKKQVLASIEKGMKIICITDHYDKDYPATAQEQLRFREKGLEPFTIRLSEYFRVLCEIQEAYRDKIDVRIGIETGLQPFLGPFYKALTEEWPFDFVIGSTHVFCGMDPYDCKGTMEDTKLYAACFEEMLEDVKQNDAFDVLGHIDYVVRYGKEQEKYYSYSAYADILDEILRTVIQKGKGIELNMAGLKYGLPFAHPHPDILRRYRELGGEIITVGSDGHKPEHLAYAFQKAKGILEAAGFQYYTVFKNRVPEFIRLD